MSGRGVAAAGSGRGVAAAWSGRGGQQGQNLPKPQWDSCTLNTITKDFYTPHPNVLQRTQVCMLLTNCISLCRHDCNELFSTKFVS